MKNYKKKALIFGVTGQDGSYLAKYLIEKKYEVFGVSRYSYSKIINFKKLGITKDKVKIFNIKELNEKKILNIIKKTNCYKIFFLSGITSVSYSQKNPIETIDTNVKYIFYILEACRKIKKKIKIYNSLSSECFGYQNNRITEKSKFYPLSPYALSKTISYYLIKYYKETYNMWISNGFVFNHESMLRPKNFVIKKIINQIKSIQSSKKNKIILGNTNISRDWGWAPEYVNFIYKISNIKKPDDFIIATSKTYNLKKIIILFLKKINIKKKISVISNNKFIRKNEIKSNYANIKKLYRKFKLKPKINSLEVMNKIYKNEYY